MGNARLRPGEITLAHRGVLFMDELPEFNRTALEALRMPLEDGEVLVSRAAGSVRLPADCMVVAAMNPCPCGLAGDPDRECTCTAQRLHAYRTRISGPLLDRFDLRVEAPRAEAHAAAGEASVTVGTRVAMARERLDERPPPLGGAAADILARAVDQMLLSGRGADRARRVAVTIAALEGADGGERRPHGRGAVVPGSGLMSGRGDPAGRDRGRARRRRAGRDGTPGRRARGAAPRDAAAARPARRARGLPGRAAPRPQRRRRGLPP